MSTTALLPTLKRVGAGRRLRFLAVILSASALLFAAVPQVAHAVGTVTIGTGSGVRGTASLADASSSTITVVAYRETADGLDLADLTEVQSGGTFSLSLEAGRYEVRYQSGGYRTACFGGDPCTRVDVVDGQAAVLSDVSLVRTTPGTVRGKVVGGDGRPLTGAAVHASNSEGVADTQTDANGDWVLAGLASEVGWKLEFTAAGHGSYEDYVYPVEAGTVDAGNVVLMLPGSVGGKVVDDHGVAMAGADVWLAPTTWGTTYHQPTATDGTYSFADVLPGRYRIRVEADGHPGTYYPGVDNFADAKLVSVTESGAVAANLTLITAGGVTGHLMGAGSPVAGHTRLYEQSRGLSGSVPTDDGYFSFTSLWPGRYTVLAEADGYAPTWLGGGTSEAGATWVDVASGVLSGDNDITLAAKPAIEAGGRVVDAGGNPVSQVTVRLGGSFEGLTDADGHFSITLDHAGTYPVAVTSGAALVCGGDAAGCATATVTVPAGGATGLLVTVPRLGSLNGAITLPDGAGIDWGQLDLVDSHGTTLATWDFSGADDYYFIGVPYGTYTIEARTEGLAPFTGSVTIGGAATRDVNLSSGFTISGQVTLPQGEEWIHVVAVDAASGKEVASLWRGLLPAGEVSYELAHVNAGAYKVGVQLPGGRWSWHVTGSDPRAATAVTVDADVPGVNLVVSAIANLARVSGRVQLPGGIAASRAAALDVRFENAASGTDYRPVIQPDGSYQVDLPKGVYQVRVKASDALGTAPLTGDLRVPAALSHDIAVPLGGSLTGRLVGADGLGVAGRVWVTAGGSTLGSVEPDSWGYWRIAALAAGPVDLHASGLGFVTAPVRTVTVGAGRTTDTGAQPLVAAGRVTVRIPDLGSDVKVTVTVTDAAGHKLASKGLWSGEPAERIDGIPAGPVLVRFESSRTITEWWRDSATLSGATAVTVKPTETSSMLVPKLGLATLPADGTISGTVTNSTGRTGGLYVTVTGATATKTVAAKADGTWSAKVQPGSYKVQATMCAGYWLGASGCMGDHVSGWYPGASAANARSVTVTSGATTGGINVDLGGPLAFRAAPVPTISGTAVVGGTLTAAAGLWKPSTESVGYRWLRDGSPIVGATAASYRVVSADGGAKLSVRVTGARAGYASTAVTSAAVTVPRLTLTLTPVPTITGTARLGSTLTAVAGTWGPGTVGLAYQWLRDGAGIGGATGPTHLVVGADAGKALTVRVTGSAPGYVSVSKTSAATARVPLGKMTTKTPTISGTPKVGRVLTAKVSGWLPVETTFTYVWYRSGKTIKGATAASYTAVAADVGKTLKVKVTGTAIGYPSASATSKSTKKVAKGTIVAGKTVITGTAKVGADLKVDTADWLPLRLTFSYQWYRSGKAISKAKAAHYVVKTSDVGRKLTVRVTASLSGYNTTSKSSKATAAVVA